MARANNSKSNDTKSNDMEKLSMDFAAMETEQGKMKYMFQKNYSLPNPFRGLPLSDAKSSKRTFQGGLSVEDCSGKRQKRSTDMPNYFDGVPSAYPGSSSTYPGSSAAFIYSKTLMQNNRGPQTKKPNAKAVSNQYNSGNGLLKPYIKFFVGQKDIRTVYINGEKMLRISQKSDLEEKRERPNMSLGIFSDAHSELCSNTVFLNEDNVLEFVNKYVMIRKCMFGGSQSPNHGNIPMKMSLAHPRQAHDNVRGELIPSVSVSLGNLCFESYFVSTGLEKQIVRTLYGKVHFRGEEVNTFDMVLSKILNHFWTLPSFDSQLIQTINNIAGKTMLNLMGLYGPFRAHEINLKNPDFAFAFSETYSEISNAGIVPSIMSKSVSVLNENGHGMLVGRLDLFSLVYQVLHCLPSLVSEMSAIVESEFTVKLEAESENESDVEMICSFSESSDAAKESSKALLSSSSTVAQLGTPLGLAPLSPAAELQIEGPFGLPAAVSKILTEVPGNSKTQHNEGAVNETQTGDIEVTTISESPDEIDGPTNSKTHHIDDSEMFDETDG
jgi:hypothetical protein